jgi:cysteine desulfurase/selenocysteine lyase
MNWDSVRSEFPALANWTVLNTASFGQLPRRATEAVANHFEHRDELACADFIDWFDDLDRIRASAARLIHAAPQDIAFIPNASTGLSILLSGLAWKPGDRVVTLKDEFPNNLYALGWLAARGVEFVECEWEHFYSAINHRTRAVAISMVNYSTGFAPPLEEISRFLRARGVLLFVDGTQSLGALQFDVRRIEPDLFAVHGYKWLLSPTGAGFLYVHPETRERLAPNVIGWRSHRDWRNVDNLHHGAPELVGSAEKYEGGMPAFPVLYAMGASIDLMLEIGPQAIEDRVLDLARQTRALIRELGAETEDHRSPIVAARFAGHDPSALAVALKERRIIVAARHGCLRISPHFYNNEDDLARLAASLREIL